MENISKSDELDEGNHETVSDELLLIIILVILVNFITQQLMNSKVNKNSKYRNTINQMIPSTIIQPHFISLSLGLLVGIII
jgi:hypothetical protein